MATQIMALPQEVLLVDDIEYLVTAMPATEGLMFMEKYMEQIDSGKHDLSTIKQVVCKYVYKDNKQVTEKVFDIIFARKLVHLQKLFQEILKYNFEDVFTEPGTEEEG